MEFAGKDRIFMLVVYIDLACLSLYLLKAIFQYAQSYLFLSVAHKTSKRIRNQVFRHILLLPASYFDQNKTGIIISKISHDVNDLQNSTQGIIRLGIAIIRSIMYFVLLFTFNWQLTLFGMLVMPVVLILLKKFALPLRKINQKITENMASIIAYLIEVVPTTKIIKIFTQENYKRDRFGALTNQIYARNMKFVRLHAIIKSSHELFIMTTAIIVVIFAGFQLIEGNLAETKHFWL